MYESLLPILATSRVNALGTITSTFYFNPSTNLPIETLLLSVWIFILITEPNQLSSNLSCGQNQEIYHTIIMPTIGKGQKAALQEAFDAVVTLLPTSLRTQLILIGGTSLIILGNDRRTEDVDFAVSTAALNAFVEAASMDARFSKGSIEDWHYTCVEEGANGLSVQIEFLEIGGGFVPDIRVVKAAGQGFRAGVGELVCMKVSAYASRGEENDLEDFRFLLDKVKETGEGFEGQLIEEEYWEDIQMTLEDCTTKHKGILAEFKAKVEC